MFRIMRRKKQQLPLNQSKEILESEKTGILAVIGDCGFPYTVPLNYFYFEDNIYFHCANQGHKIDSIKNNSKVSFCVVSQNKLVPEKYTTAYESVVVFGKAEIMKNQSEINRIIYHFAKHFAPNDSEENLMKNINSDIKTMTMVKITPEHITGKQGLELIKNK